MRRWLVFNLVGFAGFAVQIAVLAALLHAGAHYLAATVMAVEAAILHNFVWHERWTWRDRDAGLSPAARLWRFQLLNGIISLIGNVALMRVLVGALDVPPLLANLTAVLACSVVNFAAGDSLIWKEV
jgi:putative flippase GtrA